MCDIILAKYHHQLLLLRLHIILQTNYIDFVDSIVSKCTSLLTVAIDDNDNGFMAALSMTKTQNANYDLI